MKVYWRQNDPTASLPDSSCAFVRPEVPSSFDKLNTNNDSDEMKTDGIKTYLAYKVMSHRKGNRFLYWT